MNTKSYAKTVWHRTAVACASSLLAVPLFTATPATAALMSGVPDSNNNGQTDIADLIANNGVTVGDKRFMDFSYTFSGTNAPTAAQVNVQQVPGANIGLQFSFGWNALAGTMMDSLIGYKVQVLDPNFLIDQVGLGFNGFAAGIPGNAFAHVAETIQKTDGTTLGTFNVITDGAGPATDQLTNTFDVTPNLPALLVRKDILVTSVAGGLASISFVDNTYRQAAVAAVPEPASLGLLACTATTLLLRRRAARA
ncbi:MAG TPA: PEP-CTERM sorting domain-containing protein [Tepidisphaeraceae bacterium]|nr:PEP-CTERM sorting domain-containing protein [Tepidisphaeraceae bacterium]